MTDPTPAPPKPAPQPQPDAKPKPEPFLPVDHVLAKPGMVPGH